MKNNDKYMWIAIGCALTMVGIIAYGINNWGW